MLEKVFISSSKEFDAIPAILDKKEMGRQGYGIDYRTLNSIIIPDITSSHL
jgi:hypothetical protein